jgi:hypothetical protein
MELGVPYHEEDWPHGLRCGECRHLFCEGERYSQRLFGFQEEVPVSVVVCVECAT